MKKATTTLSLCVALAIGSLAATPSAYADRATRFSRDNAAGGVTSGVARNRTGPNGGGFQQRRVMRTDAQGNRQVVGGSAFKTPGGGRGARAGATYYGADGSVHHKSGIAASGPSGSATSVGGFTRNPDGTVTQQRNTNVTNSATGNSYQGSTSYNSTDGRTRSASCFDASGSEIACPSR